MRNILTLHLAAVTAVMVSFVSSVKADSIPASTYVQDGLVAHWDGIENAGTGIHDSNAATWVDLKGGTGWTINSHGSWTDDALMTDGTGYAASRASALNGIVTCEVTFNRGGSSDSAYGCIFMSGQRTGGSCAYYAYSSKEGSLLLTRAQSIKVMRDTFTTVATVYNLSGNYSTPATAVYRDGTLGTILTTDTDFMDAGGANATLGGRYSGSARNYTGKIHSLRIYNRVLTSAEIAVNANIDKMRFEGAAANDLVWPTGYRWNGTASRMEFSINVDGDDSWYPLGGSVNRTAPVRDGYRFVRWEGDVDGLSFEQISANPLIFTVDRPRTITAHYAIDDPNEITYSGNAMNIPASRYVQKDLLFHFDGIDNVGTGVHDANSMVWKDLKGASHDWQLIAGGGRFSDRGVSCIAGRSGLSVTGAYESCFTQLATVETSLTATNLNGKTQLRVLRLTRYEEASGGRGLCLNTGDVINGIMRTQSVPVGRVKWAGETFTVASTHPIIDGQGLHDIYYNGSNVTDRTTVGHPEWYQGGAYPNIGYTAAYVGDFFASRGYTRELTAAEITANAHLDQARFGFGGNVHVLGWPREIGAPSPGYGSCNLDPLEPHVFQAGPFTVFEDSVSAVDLGGGSRARCVGFMLGDSTVTNAGVSATVSFRDTMTLTWLWDVQHRVELVVGGGTVVHWVSENELFTPSAGETPADLVGWSGVYGTVSADGRSFSVTAPCRVRPVTASSTTLRRWKGTTSASAAVAANWEDGSGAEGVPANGDTVVLDGSANASPMTWDIDDVTLANWVQIGYTGTVTFKTGRSISAKGAAKTANGYLREDGIRTLKVTGDIMLESGVWTHAENPAMNAGDQCYVDGEGVWRLVVDCGGDFTLGPAAKVNLDAKGIVSDVGTHNGAHGGNYAGLSGATTAQAPYGFIKRVRTLGSAKSTKGGGNAELSVGGRTMLCGTVSAESPATYYYAGAGGGFWLRTGSLCGDGRVSVCAGSARGGGGAGGRISVQLADDGEDFSEFFGTFTANAGAKWNYAGTVYLEKKSDVGRGELRVVGQGTAIGTGTTVAGGTYVATTSLEDSTFSRVVLSDYVYAVVRPGTTLVADEIVCPLPAGNAVLGICGGTVKVPQTWAPTNMFLRAPRGFTGSRLVLGDGTGELILDNAGNTVIFDSDLEIVGNVRVKNGASARCYDYTSGYPAEFDLSVRGDLAVESGGSLTVASRGYAAKAGPGHPVVDGFTARGGAHGGGAYDTAGVTTYGSVKYPTTWGSGGNSGVGGGRMKLVVDGELGIDGTVSANGGGTKQSGAGGSIWIISGSLTGNGTITSIGGPGESESVVSAGGGGRIAVTVTNETAKISDFTGTITARGGIAKTNVGAAAGTIYLRDGDQGDNEGTLLIDGSATAKNVVVPTEISTSVTDAEVGRVVVTNGASLLVKKSCTLTVHEDFDSHGNGGLPLGEISDGVLAGGEIVFTDAAKTSLISGENPFANLTVTTPGKRMEFAAGNDSLASIIAGGVLTVTGTESDRVLLRSTSEGNQWRISLDAAASADITYADVKDSDATSGTKIVVEDDTVNSGNNDNWGFIESIVPGALIVWTGAHGTSFTDPDNWIPARAPVATDVIRIPAECDYYPTLAAPLVANKLEIEHGALLSLDGFDLTVTNGMMNAGTVNAANGTSQITLSGNVTNATFICGGSTVTLTGASAQFVHLGEQTYHNLVIANDVTFDSGFTAINLTAIATVPRQIAFAAGKLVMATYATLNGKVGDTSVLTLKSSVPNTAWRIEVLSKAEVKGVNLSDSTAVEKTLYAELPSVDQGGNNALWVFDVSSAVWTGGSAEVTKTWTNDLNWADGKVPDSTSRVVFNGAATVKLPDEGVTIRQLEIDSDSGTVRLNASGNATGEVGRVTIATTLDIMDGAVLCQNAPIVVLGDAFVRAGGRLTHPVNGDYASATNDNGYGVCLTVGNDFVIEAGGEIDALGCGFFYGCGPGCCSGASHGGRRALADHKACYGSVFKPVLLGSGGSNSAASNGGGRIRLTVGNDLTVDGSVIADGRNSGFYNASGGSVWVVCGRLLGSGRISADGAWKTSYYDPGCGGRVAVYQTKAIDFGGFENGRISTAGGGTVGSGNYPTESCGTVYLESASDGGRGIIDLWNAGGTDGGSVGVELPVTGIGADPRNAFRDKTVRVRYGARLFLTGDLEIGELEIESGGKLILAGHTLTIRSHAHRTSTPDGRGGNKGNWQGTVDYTTGDSGSTGTIRFKSSGTMLILR